LSVIKRGQCQRYVREEEVDGNPLTEAASMSVKKIT